MTKAITIHGARSNNLKNVSVSIPKGKITVVTGLSGSGNLLLSLILWLRSRSAY